MATKDNTPKGDDAPDDTAKEPSDNPIEVVRRAAGNMAAASPFAMADPAQLLTSTAKVAGKAVTDPAVRKDVQRRAIELVKIAAGRSDIDAHPKDRRFADPTWRENPLFRRLMQTYLVGDEMLRELPNRTDVDDADVERAAFMAAVVSDSMSPTNNLLTNPAALKLAAETKGGSLLAGFQNLVRDLRDNGGLPSQVDTAPFEVGENLAVTPGSVVYRTEVLELIQYEPTTEKVYGTPLVVVPPQVNKYYALDLSEGRSMMAHAVSQGQQVFMISWRNPGPDQADWNLDVYVEETIGAFRAAAEITKRKKVNVMGVCAGGMTTAAAVGYLAATNDDLVNAVTLLVTVIDSDVTTTMTALATDRVIDSSARRIRKAGVTNGSDMAKVFAWLRPSDLIWNYWINNYLMGRKPPAFDVLAWNADTTNLPAGLQIDLMRLLQVNGMANPGTWEVLGEPLDLSKVTADLFVVGAITDHITPWKAVYRTPHLFGGEAEFILSRSGHVQAMVNPPDNPKAAFMTNQELGDDADEWLEGATDNKGSWWGYWTDWLGEHGGRKKAAPKKLGSAEHEPIEAAPGSYVLA